MAQEIKQLVINRYNQFVKTTALAEQSANEQKSIADFFSCQRCHRQEELSEVPQTALNLACGCGDVIEPADLKSGHSVVDLGCGGGVDVFLAASQVGKKGRVLGIDISPDMIDRAQQAMVESKFQGTKILFREADIEKSPLPRTYADVLISNCVINLCPDKYRVYLNSYRILRPGGLLVVADIVFTEDIAPRIKQPFQSVWSGCLGGVVHEEIHWQTLKKMSFMDIQLIDRHLLTLDELKTIACCPGEKLSPPPEQEDLLKLEGKVAAIVFIATRPPLFC